MSRRSLWLIMVTALVSYTCYLRADQSPYGRYFSEVLQIIDRAYLEPVDDQKLFEGAVEGMVGRLDEYSTYIRHSEAQQFKETLDQRFGGIGIEVSMDSPGGPLVVNSPLVDSPAYRAGIQPGDEIVAIDGRSAKGMNLREVVAQLRGKPGEEVSVKVERPGQKEPIEFHLVREIIKVDSVLGDVRRHDGRWSYVLPVDPRIGYVRITEFGESTVEELKPALASLRRHDVHTAIIDLRNDPGGLLSSAEETCSLFLKAGAAVVSTRGRDGRMLREYVAPDDGPYRDFDLVVLVNRFTASAGEIVAACLQDHGRAVIIGERSWGKGTVQNIVPVEGGQSDLKLTVASYWRPSGQNIHRLKTSREGDEWGVKPDPGFEVKLDTKQLDQWLKMRRQRDVLKPAEQRDASASSDQVLLDNDPQLKKAVEYLQSKLGPAGDKDSTPKKMTG